ncbi:hypothetical protein [Alteromonas sp. a30]|uniref:hypothetical protein n=1 Tax=Alteromonas sp. a30 TaxID=2730917 RepID=UPI002281D3DC|nr:hypothetical protein [Alteromonas sp. a30]MCY7296621.1 hypothetical protein [Alteromonas sp. a30]
MEIGANASQASSLQLNSQQIEQNAPSNQQARVAETQARHDALEEQQQPNTGESTVQISSAAQELLAQEQPQNAGGNAE